MNRGSKRKSPMRAAASRVTEVKKSPSPRGPLILALLVAAVAVGFALLRFWTTQPLVENLDPSLPSAVGPAATGSPPVDRRSAGERLEIAAEARRAGDLRGAEAEYRRLLAQVPDHPQGNYQLATLLGLCGRRQEAIEPIIRLIGQGKAEDLLLLVARDQGVVDDRATLERGARREPPDPLALLGQAWHAGDRGEHPQSLALLRRAIEIAPELAPLHAALGRELAAAELLDELPAWNRQLPPGAEEFAETWLARARWAEHTEQAAASIRCYLEAARRSPELKVITARLGQAIAATEDADRAAAFAQYSSKLLRLSEVQDRIFFASQPSNLQGLQELVARYEDLGRYWEASAWLQLGVELDPQSAALRQQGAQLQSLAARHRQHLVDPGATPAGQIVLDRYPLPRWDIAAGDLPKAPTEGAPTEGAPTEGVSSSAELRLAIWTEEGGFPFRYFNGTDGPPERKMYEFPGGGIGVLDYDLDGWPDVVCSQGCAWPARFRDDRSTGVPQPADRLLRNIEGRSWREVPGAAFAEAPVQFGQGVAIGDLNADGFPDIYVANAGGPNRLYRNNGDGTFTDWTEDAGLPAAEETADGGVAAGSWTTSCLIADLSGDGLADLFDVNYVMGRDLFQRVCADEQGHPAICMPFDFDAQGDVLWINDGEGGFTQESLARGIIDTTGKGLGVVAVDLDRSGRLSVLVANDTTANQLWVPVAGADGELRFVDSGVVAGVAYNGAGKAEGCMGIAVTDLDGNGHEDFFLTNFLYETNTLYLSRGGGVYQDATKRMGFAEPSLNVLGFGTQFLDLDLDGTMELFVANGHIDDLRRRDRPYRMPPQLYQRRGDRYQWVREPALGDYFNQLWLGRAAARLDFNRDGRPDLLVGHLEDPTHLLVNETKTTNHYLRVRLVGVRSPREPIGARVTLRTGPRTGKESARDQPPTQQLVAGDGYQCSNERVLHFGLGSEPLPLEGAEVRWPSGRVESFSLPGIDDEFLLIEGRGEVVGGEQR